MDSYKKMTVFIPGNTKLLLFLRFNILSRSLKISFIKGRLILLNISIIRVYKFLVWIVTDLSLSNNMSKLETQSL